MKNSRYTVFTTVIFYSQVYADPVHRLQAAVVFSSPLGRGFCARGSVPGWCGAGASATPSPVARTWGDPRVPRVEGSLAHSGSRSYCQKTDKIIQSLIHIYF